MPTLTPTRTATNNRLNSYDSEPMLSPYAHELDPIEPKCAPACPACRWAQNHGAKKAAALR